MDKVDGLVNMLVILSWTLQHVEAQFGGVCQFPSRTCVHFQRLCSSGDNGITDLNGYCGHMIKTNCYYANGPHCQGSQGPQPPTPWSGRFGQNTQPPDPWNRRFTPGYQPTGGARSQQQSCDIQDWRKRALDLTNKLRARHGVEPLVEDPNIQRTSQPYADKVIRGEATGHNPNVAGIHYGENYAWGTINYSPEYQIQRWYDENVNWDYNSATGNGVGETGHFTQLVWKSSKRVGHGIAFDSRCTQAVIIADYYPPGNYPSGYRQNVLPPVKNPIGPSQTNSPMSFGHPIRGSANKGASIQLGKMCSGSSLLLFWLRANGYMD